jgi:hypothetical protein
MSTLELLSFLRSLHGDGVHDAGVLIAQGVPKSVATINQSKLGKVSDACLLDAIGIILHAPPDGVIVRGYYMDTLKYKGWPAAVEMLCQDIYTKRGAK